MSVRSVKVTPIDYYVIWASPTWEVKSKGVQKQKKFDFLHSAVNWVLQVVKKHPTPDDVLEAFTIFDPEAKLADLPLSQFQSVRYIRDPQCTFQAWCSTLNDVSLQKVITKSNSTSPEVIQQSDATSELPTPSSDSTTIESSNPDHPCSVFCLPVCLVFCVMHDRIYMHACP